jgi:TraM recognition site of TraD and TraG/Type IV secretion-system coupling protein DNA-binding domain
MRHHPGQRLEGLLYEPDRTLHQLPSLAHHALSTLEHAAPILAALLAALGIARLVVNRVRRRRLAREARLVTIGVPPEVEAGGALLLWSALHDLLRPHLARLLAGQPHLAWEIAASETGTVFRMWVPGCVPPGLIERAVASAWPGASTTTEPASFDASEGPIRVASELVLSGPGWFPLNAAMNPDPLPLILGQLAGLREGQCALVQVLARPATIREQRRLRTAARRLRAGIPPGRLARLLDFLTTTRAPTPPRHDPTISPDVRDVMSKSAQPLYRCLIRVTVSARSRGEARGRIHAILGGFAAYEGRVGLRRRGMRGAQAKLRDRWIGRRAFLAGADELAALAHLPGQDAIPGVVMAGAREVAPPPGLPSTGKPLGVGANGRQVNLAVADARQHLHVLGPTGVGKSTLIGRLVLADFDAGRGAVVIDPKGDLIEDLLARIPPGRENEVDLMDPMDSAPPGLNVLDSPDRDLGVDQLVGIFRRVFERFWGPRTDDVFRAALLTLTAAPTATLADVPRLLSDTDFQAELVGEIDDPVGLGPFWEWYQGLSEGVRAQAIGPLLNKLRAFLLRGPVRAIVGQPKTTLNIPRAINEGRLLLVRLPKGTLGEDTSRLLGSMVVARVWQAALARAALPPEQRRDAALYVDEVQNFLNLPTPIPDVLAEARGYRLSLCMAHQHLGQLTRELREGIAANARTKVYFQVSRDDAATLEREVRPELAAHDLAHLPVHTAAVRLCHDGQTSSAFTVTTEALPPDIPGQAENVRTATRHRIGVPREQTEAWLAERQRHQTAPARRRVRQPSPSSPAKTGDSVLSSVLPSLLSSVLPSDLRTEPPTAGESPANLHDPPPDSAPDKGGE